MYLKIILQDNVPQNKSRSICLLGLNCKKILLISPITQRFFYKKVISKTYVSNIKNHKQSKKKKCEQKQNFIMVCKINYWIK